MLLQHRIGPILGGFGLTGLLAGCWLTGGTVSPTLPQTLSDHAWRELWKGHSDGPNGAIDLFRGALAADPTFPYRWSDLGDALAAYGRTDEARYCFQRSIELAPNSPQIAMRAANFHFRAGNTAAALQLSGAVLQITASYDGIVFSTMMRLGGDLNTILERAIGTNTRAANAFFIFLAGAPDTNYTSLSQTWQWMERRSWATPELARIWTGWLIGQHHDEDAYYVWKRYVARNRAYGVTNWIDDSGFEYEPAANGFDWRLTAFPGVKTSLDAAVSHSGRHALRLDFDGTANVDFHHVEQHVWAPAGRYRLSAWVRTAKLTTDQGVYLAFRGVSTPALTGSHDWSQVSAEITVPGGGAAGEVQVMRQHSWRFDSKISGTVWIDDVELQRID